MGSPGGGACAAGGAGAASLGRDRCASISRCKPAAWGLPEGGPSIAACRRRPSVFNAASTLMRTRAGGLFILGKANHAVDHLLLDDAHQLRLTLPVDRGPGKPSRGQAVEHVLEPRERGVPAMEVDQAGCALVLQQSVDRHP